MEFPKIGMVSSDLMNKKYPLRKDDISAGFFDISIFNF